MFRVENLEVKFNQTLLFSGVNLSLDQGERLALLGPSGSGKSTLLRMCSGLEVPNQGHIFFKNQEMNQWNIPYYRSQVMYLPQKPFTELIRVERFFEAPFSYKIYENKAYDQTEAKKLLHLFQKSDFLEKSMSELSGGELQLIVLIRAILLTPKILLLDESLSAMDAYLKNQVVDYLKSWCDLGGALIFITHDPGVIDSLKTQEYVFKKKRAES